MIEGIRSYIQQHQLLNTSGLVLTALSGGADSVALFLILKELGYHIEALHCNFHLRGEESDRDERYVSELCQKHAIKLHTKHFDTLQYAQQTHVSIEMAARELRYEWFQEIYESTNAQAIAVAHHINDQAETLLLNLLRGSGIKGLSGMHPRQGNIVRPLLCVTREMILQYLAMHNQPFVSDSSNEERDAMRNIIRLDVMPLLEKISPKAQEAMAQAAEIARNEYPYYQQGIQQDMHKFGITGQIMPVQALQCSASPRCLLHEWLQGKGFTHSQEEEILTGAEKAKSQLWKSKTHELLHDREQLILKNIDSSSKQDKLYFCISIQDKMDEFEPHIAYFDADLLKLPLTIRKVANGDRFVPFGMKGSRLVSDFLTDLKTDLFQKQEQLVACSGEDIVWVIGKRSDNRFRVTKNTRKILKIQIIQ